MYFTSHQMNLGDGELRQPTVPVTQTAVNALKDATKATKPPTALTSMERLLLRDARLRVRQLYPPSIAAIVSDHLGEWEQFGYRFGGKSPVMQPARDIMATPIPETGP